MFLGFTLKEELGRGAFARVYLAHQESLSGREVALKVTLRATREPERLARLQHTNIVPIYSVHESLPVQVICMPFLGRRTIADLVRAYRDELSSRGPGTRNTSRAIHPDKSTDLANSSSGRVRNPLSGAYPRPRPLSGNTAPIMGDPRAVLGVLAQLADGLAHAHGRGILHLDLKPANVLLADTGESMLLDFNLSFDKNSPIRELVGGTVPYMAIEQLIDLKSRGHGDLDVRTDLYSLGVMAFEMLSSTVPFPAPPMADIESLIEARRQGAPSLRALNPAVTPAIEAIVQKLLAPDPENRYQTADDLRTDLNRQLNDLPLSILREPSLRERLGKWRRRNPGTPSRLLSAIMLGLVIGVGAAAYMRVEENARTAALAKVLHARASLDPIRLDLVVPNDSVARARGIEKAEELLATYGLPDDVAWMKRAGIRHLSERERTSLTADLGELLVLVAQAKWHEVASKPTSERREGAAIALKFSRAAHDCFAPGSIPLILSRQTAELAAAAGESPHVAESRDTNQKPSIHELFLEAAFGTATERFAAAVPLLEQVTSSQSNHGAAQFCLAYCRQHLGQTDRALERYDVAERYLPGDPRPAFQRGVIYGLKDNQEDAEKEFTKAIDMDSEYVNAHRNRGFARFRLGKFEEAEMDLTQALELGAPAIQIHLYRAQVRRGLGKTAGADADQRAAAALTPKSEADYIARGIAHLIDAPQDALADFRAAEEINPRSLVALKNQVYVLAERLNKTNAALGVATRMSELFPDCAPGRIARAILLARLGKRADAHAEVEKAQRLSKDAAITYRAACVFALTSATHAEDRAKALTLLELAIKDGFREGAGIKFDHDLDPIRDSKRFREIADAAASLFQ
jgi:eukaryotic-like serine/threonine-protein kinase